MAVLNMRSATANNRWRICKTIRWIDAKLDRITNRAELFKSIDCH